MAEHRIKRDIRQAGHSETCRINHTPGEPMKLTVEIAEVDQ